MEELCSWGQTPRKCIQIEDNVRLISLFLNYSSYLAKFHKFFNGLEGDFRIISNGLKPDHFIHVIGRNWSNYIFFFLVEPDLLILLELTFIHLVEQGKWSWFVDFLSFLGLLGFIFGLFVGCCFFFLVFWVCSDVDFIRIIFRLFGVDWFEASLDE